MKINMYGWMPLALLFICLTSSSFAQVVIDGKNVNNDNDIEYIQLSFYYDGKNLNPVYAVDFGAPIDENKVPTKQVIVIDKDHVTERMTPARVFNKLYKAGWEYVGDAVFMRAPLVENTQVYTFRRRKSH